MMRGGKQAKRPKPADKAKYGEYLRSASAAAGGLALMLLLGGCGDRDAGPALDARQDGQRGEWSMEDSPWEGIGRTAEISGNRMEPVSLGGASCFKDDSGKNTQLSEGWLYGYWGRQLCRVDVDTLETEVLFRAASPQEGHFSIYDGNIYFVEQRHVSYLNGAKANLWRMGCDGSGLELLVEGVDITEGYTIGTSTISGMEIYDDILYLLGGNADGEDNRYFRLNGDGGAEEISADETLYGMVPEGYRDACSNSYRFVRLPNLVYCVRNYGYALVCDGSGSLYRLTFKSGELERIPLAAGSATYGVLLTGSALIYRDFSHMWYCINLEDLEDPVEIGRMECSSVDDIVFWDAKGICYVERDNEDEGFNVGRLNWSGETEALGYWVRNPRLRNEAGLTVLYSDGSYLYYDALSGGDGVICRIPLEGQEHYSDEAQQVFTYYEDAAAGLSTRETFATTFTVEATGHRGSFSVTKVRLTEKTEAAARINRQLEEIYRSEEEYMAEMMDSVRDIAAGGEEVFGWPGSMTCVENTLRASVIYLDENYIGISFGWYEYWSGAAHGLYGSTEYVFSRSTGQRLTLTDVLENSPEEICTIIAPYVEEKAEWGTGGEGWEQMILEDWRFYLTPEGIGIHFDTYELTSYASGGLDVVVPYGMFQMRSPIGVEGGMV